MQGEIHLSKIKKILRCHFSVKLSSLFSSLVHHLKPKMISNEKLNFKIFDMLTWLPANNEQHPQMTTEFLSTTESNLVP